MAFYPVNIKLAGRLCIVVGGGNVAARKIDSLLGAEARVRVISPVVCGRIAEYAARAKIEWVRKEYSEGDLTGAFLVFATTDKPLVQKQVASETKKVGALLNSADDPTACDFQVPAKLRRGDLLIAVSTGGASPALSAQIKQGLLNTYGLEYSQLVELLGQVRRAVVADGRESAENRTLFHTVLEQPLAQLIKDEHWSEIVAILEGLLPNEIDCQAIVSAVRAEKPDLCGKKMG